MIVEATDAAPSDGESGAWIASGPRIGPGTLERILCESTCEILARIEDGTPLAVGDSQTAIPPRTRRWVVARDGGMCTADGYRSVTRLQPHHIHDRASHGDNRHGNLTTLCWFHHHVVFTGAASESPLTHHPSAAGSSHPNTAPTVRPDRRQF